MDTFIPINQQIPDENSIMRKQEQNMMYDIRVATPGIINSVNYANSTVNVQPAIRERIVGEDGTVTFQPIPIIPNVPIHYPSGAGTSFTWPIAQGDECLLIFTDQSFDNWWLYGQVQNPIEQRRHDLTDAIAIVGIKSQPLRLPIPAQPTVTGNLVVTGNVTINGNLQVDSRATINGDTTMKANAEVGRYLQVNMSTNINGDLELGGTLGVVSSAHFDSDIFAYAQLINNNTNLTVHTHEVTGSTTGGPR